MDSETNSPNYSYTSPTNTKQQVVYVERPKKNNALKYILGCTFLLLLFLCICGLPFLFIASFSSTLTNSANSDITSRVEEKKVTEISNSSSETARIALVDVSGSISYTVPGTTSYELGASSENIIAQLQKAKNDESIDAVVMRFNTPGGEVTAAEPICNAIKETNKIKPVYTFIDSMGASLGYLLPNCTKYIYARPEAVTGSIGVVLQAVDYYGVLEKLGGKVVFVTNSAGTQKTGQDIFDTNSETYKTYQGILDETFDYFLNTVTSGRKSVYADFQRDALVPLANGRIFSGKQAKDLRLVDELGQYEEVLRSISNREQKLKGKNIDVIQYSIYSSPFSQFFSGAKSALKSADIKESVKDESKVRLLMELGVINSNQPANKE